MTGRSLGWAYHPLGLNEGVPMSDAPQGPEALEGLTRDEGQSGPPPLQPDQDNVLGRAARFAAIFGIFLIPVGGIGGIEAYS